MNFEKAEDRANHHLLNMEWRMDSMAAVQQARDRLYRLWNHKLIDQHQYSEVGEWIEEQASGIYGWRKAHPKFRHPVDPLI